MSILSLCTVAVMHYKCKKKFVEKQMRDIKQPYKQTQIISNPNMDN